MSSNEINKTAEELFREAFERLKRNKPVILPKGTPLSQNNVAKEAGRDPSALKKSRYPLLVLEIQEYSALQESQEKKVSQQKDNRKRKLQEKLKDCQNQRDQLCSIVDAQQNLIEELQDRIQEFEAGKVSHITKKENQ